MGSSLEIPKKWLWKAPMLSKAQRGNEVIDIHGQFTLVKVHLKQEEMPLPQAQGSRRATIPSPNSSLLSPSGQMIPVNPSPALRWGLCLWLENQKHQLSEAFPPSRSLEPEISAAAFTWPQQLSKRKTALFGTAPLLSASVSFPSRTARSHLEAESQHLREICSRFAGWREVHHAGRGLVWKSGGQSCHDASERPWLCGRQEAHRAPLLLKANMLHAGHQTPTPHAAWVFMLQL